MKMVKGFVIGVAVTLLLIIAGGGAYYLGMQSKKNPQEPAATAVTETIISPTEFIEKPEPTIAEVSNIPEGWLTYKNEEYGFEISYPKNYKALSDAENLYGWPNALVLIYNGGQSYDLPIEVWDTRADYEAKYPNAVNLTVKETGSKYITLMNVNFEEEVDTIISTFKFTP